MNIENIQSLSLPHINLVNMLYPKPQVKFHHKRGTWIATCTYHQYVVILRV
jgi:hypothetical protein